MTEHVAFKLCYGDNDLLGWLLSYVLWFPVAVWFGFMITGFIIRSPMLVYKSWISSGGTSLLAWGLSTYLKWERPNGQTCDRSYAYPDVGFQVAVVNVTVILMLICGTRRDVSRLFLLSLGGWMVLYFVAIFVNGYLTFLQLLLNLGFAMVLSSFWATTYMTIARPILTSYGVRETITAGMAYRSGLPSR